MHFIADFFMINVKYFIKNSSISIPALSALMLYTISVSALSALMLCTIQLTGVCGISGEVASGTNVNGLSWPLSSTTWKESSEMASAMYMGGSGDVTWWSCAILHGDYWLLIGRFSVSLSAGFAMNVFSLSNLFYVFPFL